jgi:GTP-binding protein HflX
MIESELPRPQVEFDVLLPYERGDLVNRIHQEAEIGSLEHTGDGTLVVGRANADLAGELAAYSR